MPRTLVKKTKKTAKEEPKKKQPETEEEEDTEEEKPVSSIKKPLEIDEPEPILPLEEKLDDDAVPVIDEEDAVGTEETGIDEEELDPFGDKWEQ